jgi:hypothetical protein
VIGESHEREEPVRTPYHNRQARRVDLCIGSRRRQRRARASAVSGIWLTAYGRDLAQVAARIGDGIQLPPELVDLLSPACLPSSASITDR